MQQQNYGNSTLDKAKKELTKKVVTELATEVFKKTLKKSAEKKLQKKLRNQAMKKVSSRASRWVKWVGKYVGFGVGAGILAKEKYDAQQASVANIKDTLSFNVSNNSYEHTLGFLMHFESDNVLAVYKVNQQNGVPSLEKVGRRNVSNSSHMLIHVLQNDNTTPVTLYRGKLIN